MPYTAEDPGQYGPTYKALVLEGESEYLGAVREPRIVFERQFILVANEPNTTAGILVQETGQPDLYVWKCLNAAAGTTWFDLVFALREGQGLRLYCAVGQFIFSWRERYRMNT